MDEKKAETIAVFRYGVLRDLVSRALAPGERERLLADIASKEWKIPGTTRCRIGRSTARDWFTLYGLHGFEGLKPAPRSDSGGSRTLSQPIQEEFFRKLFNIPQGFDTH